MANRKIAAVLASVAAVPVLAASAPEHSPFLARVDDICSLRTADRIMATTRGCLSCHDGSVASNHVSLARNAGMERSHPVDIVYASSLARLPGKLHVRYDMPQRLVLPDGRVTCITCHDGASSEPFHVALPMNGSRLCFGCHNL